MKLGYKRIDKDYRSMGAYFFLTDVAQWTVSPNLNLVKNRLRIQGSVGSQRDNLAGLQSNTTSRFIGSGNLSFYPNQVFGLDVRYANYGLSQNPIQRNLADTTLLEQVTQNFTILPRLTFQKDQIIQTWIGMLGYHALSDQSESIVYEAEMQTWFGFLQYQMNLRESGWNFQASANGQRVTLPQGQTESLGGTIGVSRSLSKGKLSLQASGSLFRNWFQQNPNGITKTYQASLNWRMHKQHSLRFRVRHLINEAPLGGPVPDFNESQGSIAYVFSFQ